MLVRRDEQFSSTSYDLTSTERQDSPECTNDEALLEEIKENVHDGRNLLHGSRFMKKLGHAALAASAVLGPSSYLTANAWENYATATSNTASIDYVRPPLDKEKITNNAIVMFDGLGSVKADRLADIGSAVQQVTDGEIWSVDYGNAPLNPNELANQITKKMDDRGIDSVTLQGYSAGGSISLQVAEALIVDHHIQVPLITMIMTPNGSNGIAPERQQLSAQYSEAMTKFPMAAYSDPVRMTGEMIDRRDQYLDQEHSVRKFFKTAREVTDSINSGDRAAPWLMTDQLLAISGMDTNKRLKRIAEDKDALQPTIMYLRPDETGYDSFVDNKRSSKEICKSAKKQALDCYIYEVPGARHNNPSISSKQYKDTLADHKRAIKDSLADRYTTWYFQHYDDTDRYEATNDTSE